jgi:hypothetical protein
MPTGGWACLGIVVVVVLLVPISAALERRRLRRARAAFLQGRREMPDAAFLAQAGARSDEVSFFLAGRQVMAALCGLPADQIGPEDGVRTLMDLQWDNGYVEDFVFALEIRAGGRLPRGHSPEQVRFGDYLRQLHQQWVPPATEEASR